MTLYCGWMRYSRRLLEVDLLDRDDNTRISLEDNQLKPCCAHVLNFFRRTMNAVQLVRMVDAGLEGVVVLKGESGGRSMSRRARKSAWR